LYETRKSPFGIFCGPHAPGIRKISRFSEVNETNPESAKNRENKSGDQQAILGTELGPWGGELSF
jgi:hypothetical protein